MGWQAQQVGEGIAVTGLVFAATGIGIFMTLPAFALGAAINAWGGKQTVGWSRPCSDNQDTAGVTF